MFAWLVWLLGLCIVLGLLPLQMQLIAMLPMGVVVAFREEGSWLGKVFGFGVLISYVTFQMFVTLLLSGFGLWLMGAEVVGK